MDNTILNTTAGPPANEEPWPIFANRETRRKCARNGHFALHGSSS